MSNVLTLGTFDLIHSGHVSFFRECNKLSDGGIVTVAVNHDAFVTRFKNRAPVLGLQDRMNVISAIRYVHRVVENSGEDQAALIESLRPDWLTIGVDWARKDYYAQLGITAEWLRERGISLAYLAHERSESISSTKLRERLLGCS